MKFLIVEDQPQYRENAITALESIGVSSESIVAHDTIASCGEAAISEAPDVVILSMLLHGFSDGQNWGGLNFAQRYLNPKVTKIIVYSSNPGSVPKYLDELGFEVLYRDDLPKADSETLAREFSKIFRSNGLNKV